MNYLYSHRWREEPIYEKCLCDDIFVLQYGEMMTIAKKGSRYSSFFDSRVDFCKGFYLLPSSDGFYFAAIVYNLKDAQFEIETWDYSVDRLCSYSGTFKWLYKNSETSQFSQPHIRKIEPFDVNTNYSPEGKFWVVLQHIAYSDKHSLQQFVITNKEQIENFLVTVEKLEKELEKDKRPKPSETRQFFQGVGVAFIAACIGLGIGLTLCAAVTSIFNLGSYIVTIFPWDEWLNNIDDTTDDLQVIDMNDVDIADNDSYQQHSDKISFMGYGACTEKGCVCGGYQPGEHNICRRCKHSFFKHLRAGD